MRLLKMWAEWCAPCKIQSTLLEDFKECEVQSIDVETDIDAATEYKVRSVPTLILVDSEGKELWRSVGLTNVDVIKNKIQELS